MFRLESTEVHAGLNQAVPSEQVSSELSQSCLWCAAVRFGNAGSSVGWCGSTLFPYNTYSSGTHQKESGEDWLERKLTRCGEVNQLTSLFWMRKCLQALPQCTDRTYPGFSWLFLTKKSPSFLSSCWTSNLGITPWYQVCCSRGSSTSCPTGPLGRVWWGGAQKIKSPTLKMCLQKKKKLKETTVSGVKDDSVEDI